MSKNKLNKTTYLSTYLPNQIEIGYICLFETIQRTGAQFLEFRVNKLQLPVLSKPEDMTPTSADNVLKYTNLHTDTDIFT